jgi:hypothetical protein
MRAIERLFQKQAALFIAQEGQSTAPPVTVPCWKDA